MVEKNTFCTYVTLLFPRALFDSTSNLIETAWQRKLYQTVTDCHICRLRLSRLCSNRKLYFAIINKVIIKNIKVRSPTISITNQYISLFATEANSLLSNY